MVKSVKSHDGPGSVKPRPLGPHPIDSRSGTTAWVAQEKLENPRKFPLDQGKVM